MSEESKLGRVSVDEHGFSLESQVGASVSMLWSEIVAVSVLKLDMMEGIGIVTLIAFEYESGHTIEVDVSCHGFQQLLTAAQEQLPGLGDDVRDRILSASIHDPPLVLWMR